MATTQKRHGAIDGIRHVRYLSLHLRFAVGMGPGHEPSSVDLSTDGRSPASAARLAKIIARHPGSPNA